MLEIQRMIEQLSREVQTLQGRACAETGVKILESGRELGNQPEVILTMK